MSTSMVDRFHFLARSTQQVKTPIRAEAPEAKTTDGRAVLRLYDPIDSWGEWWGVSAKEFAAALDDLDDDVTTIELHINSPGGEVHEGIAILNALRQHPAKVVAVVDGVAASAASFVAVGAGELVMARNSELMIHDAWGVCVGNAGDMAKMAGDLGHFSANLAAIYAAKAGGTVDVWREAMAAETWYSADEAVAAGLADRVVAADDAEKVKARFDLSVFAHAGRGKAPAPRFPAAASASGSTTENPEESMTLSEEQVSDLRNRLGIADENADGDAILAALDEALAEQTTDPPEPTTALPEGTVTIDEGQLEELRVAARAGLEARAQQQTEHRERVVNAAVADGRISPARRDAWLARLATDPGEDAALASLAPGLVPLAAIGHNGGDDTEPDVREDPRYKNWSTA